MQNNAVRAKRSFASVVIASLLAALGMLTTPAAGYASTSQAYPVSEYRLEYGASVLAGSITWYNRNVGGPGFLKAVSGAKGAHFRFVSDNCNKTAALTTPDRTTKTFTIGGECDFPGGFTRAYVTMFDALTGNKLISATCTRNGCIKD